MKLNIGKLLKSVVRKVKDNPEIALMVLGVVSPKLARKAVALAPVIVAAIKKPKAE
ncbi:MAG TPA: hypothetical protein VF637_17440 [Sphingomicrobium sp.]|jgi:uncharacterized protein YejL (UPF0352 family)